MSADTRVHRLGPDLAARVRPRIRLVRSASGRAGVGAIARRSVGFGLAIGRSGAARPRIERTDGGLTASRIRPPVVHWRSTDDGFDPEFDGATPGPAGRDPTGTVRSARRDTISRSGGTRPTAPAQVEQPSLGDSKVDALRRMLSSAPTPTSADAGRARPAAERPGGAPIADPNAPTALRREVADAPTASASRTPRPGSPRQRAESEPALTDTSTPTSSSPSDTILRSVRHEQPRFSAPTSPGGTAAGPRTGPGQLGRRLRPETAEPAPETNVAPIPVSAAVPVATSPTSPTRGTTSDPRTTARTTRSRPRSGADRIAALRRTVEQHHVDAPDASPATTRPETSQPRPDPNQPRPDPNRPQRRSTPAAPTPTSTTQRGRSPARPPGTTAEPRRSPTPAEPGRGSTSAPSRPRPGPNPASADADIAPLRPLGVLRRHDRTSLRSLAHSRSTTRRPLTRVTAVLQPDHLVVAPGTSPVIARTAVGDGATLIGPSPIATAPSVSTSDATPAVEAALPHATEATLPRSPITDSDDTMPGATLAATMPPMPAERTRRRPDPASPVTRSPASPITRAPASPITRAPASPITRVPASPITRAPAATSPGSERARARRTPTAPSSSVLLARPGSLFARATSTRSVVAAGPGALAPALRTVESIRRNVETSTPGTTDLGTTALGTGPAAVEPEPPTADRGAPGPARRRPSGTERGGEPTPAPSAPSPRHRRPQPPIGEPPADVSAAIGPPANTLPGESLIARAPVSEPVAAARERSDALAQRFLGELGRGAPPRPTPIPATWSPMAEAITGRRRVMISTDAVSRRALRSVGKPAATTDDVIHLDRPLVTSDRRSTEILAHELTHVAHPSPAPRFFDDDHRGPEERRAEQVAQIMTSSPLVPGSRTVRRRSDTPRASGGDDGHSSSSPGSVTAADLAARLTGDGSTIRRSPARSTPTVSPSSFGTTGGDRIMRRAAPDAGGPDEASAPPAPSDESDGAPRRSVAEAASAAALIAQLEAISQTSHGREWFRRLLLEHSDVLLRTIEDHVIVELERRGGRSWGNL